MGDIEQSFLIFTKKRPYSLFGFIKKMLLIVPNAFHGVYSHFFNSNLYKLNQFYKICQK